MLPIGDDDSQRRTVPVVTYALIVLNVLFFLVELSSGEAFIDRWSVVPSRLLANPVRDFITVFTAMFMHGGWMHLLGNMLYLWIFGDNVEDRLGQVKFVIFYLLCGIAATFAQVLVDPTSNVPNLGASGAIAATGQTEGGGVAYMAHVGGFIAGLILGPLMAGRRSDVPRFRSY